MLSTLLSNTRQRRAPFLYNIQTRAPAAIAVAALLALPLAAHAYDLQVPLSSSTISVDTDSPQAFTQYIVVLFKFVVWFAISLAILVVMIAGFMWMMAGGSPDRVGRAKQLISGALSGLVLSLFSFIILETINPQLVNIEVPEIASLKTEFIKDPGLICCVDSSGETWREDDDKTCAERDMRDCTEAEKNTCCRIYDEIGNHVGEYVCYVADTRKTCEYNNGTFYPRHCNEISNSCGVIYDY